jgi:transposase
MPPVNRYKPTRAQSSESEYSLMEFMRDFPDDATSLEWMWRHRFSKDGEHAHCPKCRETRVFKRYETSQQRQSWTCTGCGHHLHVLAGTIFHKSSTSLHLWFYAMYLMTSTRCGISAKQLERELGVTYKTAWRMAHEIRKHMAAVDGEEPLSGVVEVDETMVGGHRPGPPGRGALGKTIVLGVVERDGDVVTKVIPDFAKSTIQPIVEANVEKGSTVHTDEMKAYGGLAAKGYEHQAVKHKDGEYVDGECHVNTIEGYWSRLKNSIRGTHVHVSGKHLQKYAGEFEYRYNRRRRPAAMLPELLGTFPPSDE